MPRSRSRPKQKKTRVKVRAKPVTKKARIASDAAAFFDRSSLTYDTSESQFANYARLGLLADANQIGAKRDTILGFKPLVDRACKLCAEQSTYDGPEADGVNHGLSIDADGVRAGRGSWWARP